MFEENVNKIVEETNDLLDILKSYMNYYITFKVERELYMNSEDVIYDSAIRGMNEAFGKKIEKRSIFPTNFDEVKTLYIGYGKEIVVNSLKLSKRILTNNIEEFKERKAALYIKGEFVMLVDGKHHKICMATGSCPEVYEDCQHCYQYR
jgi:hypothetical protein